MRRRIQVTKHAAKRHMHRLAVGVLMILSGCMIFGSFFVSAHENTSDQTVYTYYKSIEIQPGDTLWDIAKRFYTTTEEIQKLNGLKSETLQPMDSLLLVKKVEP